MNCLVTGATGYLGTVLVETLYNAKHKVTAFCFVGEDTSHISAFCNTVFGDVCKMETIEHQIKEMDVVIHLAGVVDITTRNKEFVYNVNVCGAKNVADVCFENEIKMIHCSSVHAMPVLKKPNVMQEILDFNPDRVEGDYSKSKAAATGYIFELCKKGLDAMIVYPSGIIGPYERRVSNIGELITQFLRGHLNIYFDGEYNFVDVRDVANGITKMLDNWKKAEGYILSGEVVTVKQMLDVIAEASNRKKVRIKLPYWLIYLISYLADFYYYVQKKKPLFTPYSIRVLKDNCNFSNEKAVRDLEFSARNYKESLIDMTNWIVAHFSP